MKRALFVVVGVVLAAIGASCAWDRDTLAAEMKGLPGMADVIAGRIDRNPDLYYEMRIERSLKEVALKPHRVDLYDDLAVAYDRLGDHDEALVWCEKKLGEMAKTFYIEGVAEREMYKYYANKGTSLVHRWIAEGADRNDLGDLKEGLAELERAIEINPDAHFGREAIQVAFVKSLLEPDMVNAIFSEAFPELRTGRDGRDRFREGVIGIMVLGEAWESVDAFRLLKGSAGGKDTTVRHLIDLKVEQLESEGKVGMLDFSVSGGIFTGMGGLTGQEGDIEKAFSALQGNGEEYRDYRDRYMMARLEKGEHPDTHEDFWDEYAPPKPVNLSFYSPPWGYPSVLDLVLWGCGLTAVGAIGWTMWKSIGRRKGVAAQGAER